MGPPSTTEQRGPPFVSTGHLPEPDIAHGLPFDAHLRFKTNRLPSAATRSRR
jgi:glutaminase